MNAFEATRGSRGRPTRRPRILMILPAGMVHDHDRVHAYPGIEHHAYANIGDMMVHESTLRLLDYDWVEPLEIASLDERAVDRANESFDYVFLRGSNFIHEFMDWEDAPRIIERLRIPVHALGVGAQAAVRRRIDLPEPARRVWSAISERCTSIGVRGEYSAEVLADNGIRNVEIIGCPTMFRSRSRDLRLRRSPGLPTRVAMSLRREAGDDYARDVESYSRIQKALMLRLNGQCDLRVTIHGEPEEKAFLSGDPAGIENAIQSLRLEDWLTEEDEATILRIYRRQLFLYQSGDQYDGFLKDIQLTVGYRVHGVLPALARGIPSVLIDYDERSRELATALDVPLMSEERAATADLQDFLDPAPFDRWRAAYPRHYDRFEDHLDRNGIPNRM